MKQVVDYEDLFGLLCWRMLMERERCHCLMACEEMETSWERGLIYMFNDVDRVHVVGD